MNDHRDITPAGGRPRGFRLGPDDEASDGLGDDRLNDPALVDGITARRILGYLVDVLLLGAVGVAGHLLVFMTLGLAAGLVYPLLVVLPLAYHTYFVASAASATPGQRLLGLEVRRLDGGKPGLLQAFVMVALFYMTLTLTSGLLLFWCLIDDRARCLHDIFSGTLVIRSDRLAAPAAG
ncbi:MAG: RDD family protein [Marivibrio sp.]|uniref:RDD family protein n=1 Tax=Marivibrio sp. TaxID=2039719 RepID=UPI0032EDEE84